jgi:Domain of unknown function (DUF4864)
MITHLAIWGFCLLAAFSISASIALADGQRIPLKDPTTMPSPKADLAPRDVVKIVVDALKKNDANDSGIRTTFKFASPGNQQQTGPIERFIPMVKSPAYQPMINSRSVEVHELSIDETTAEELAIIVDSNGDKAYYIFQLAKQPDGDLKDCWMTDGVVRVEPKDAPADKPQPKPDRPGGSTPV